MENQTNPQNLDPNAEALATILPMLASLEAELNKEAPDIKLWMYQLNNNLRMFPELVLLLKDEEIKPYYQAIQSQTMVAITKPPKALKTPKVAKPKGAFGAKMAGIKFGNSAGEAASDNGDLFDGL